MTPHDPEPGPDLARALRELADDPRGFPRDLDERVRAAARGPLAQRRGRAERRLWRPLVLGGALATAAAAAALLLVLALRGGEEAEETRPETSVADVDGDGRVDVVDAYGLARRLAAGETPNAPDLDGDGDVDGDDVEAVLREAVRLER